MNTLNAVVTRVEDFFRTVMNKYRDGYMAQVNNLPDIERKTSHRGMFLP
jgi:hypothetical protein